MEPQITLYIIKTVRTKCIIAEALKVRGQKYDRLSLKIVQTSLHLVNIQPNSKFHVPHQNFLDSLLNTTYNQM